MLLIFINNRKIVVFQEGMGRLKIVEEGLQLRGRAMVLDSLVASSIRSRPGAPISIDSSHNFSVSARDHAGRTVSRLLLGESFLLPYFPLHPHLIE